MEPEYNIESKWLEEINIIHANIEKMKAEASKVVDVERLEKSFESNLAFLREQIKSEIGAKADTNPDPNPDPNPNPNLIGAKADQIQLEDALREVVEEVEAVH